MAANLDLCCMKQWKWSFILLMIVTLTVNVEAQLTDTSTRNTVNSVRVGDAFAYSSDAGRIWKIGSKGIEMSFEIKAGNLKLIGFKNTFLATPVEYLSQSDGIDPFAATPERNWTVRQAVVSQQSSGGQPVVQLEILLENEAIINHFFLMAYPGSSVIRQWVELENKGNKPVKLDSSLFTVPITAHSASPLTHYWMVGGNSKVDQGKMHQDTLKGAYKRTIQGRSTSSFIPWTAFHREGGANDGWFAALEYLGGWELTVNPTPHQEQWLLSATVPDLAAMSLEPNKKIALPALTLCSFAGSLDEMTVQSYNWQYRYLWDYTNMAYYAKPKWLGPWTYAAQNLQEQFGGRLAYLDMNAEVMRTMGFEMLWDDAGWSSHSGMPPDNYGSVFAPTYEGPDFNQTRHFLNKMGMGWLAWFAGRPSPGIMSSKVGAWGDFEWRSDAVGFPNWKADRDWREKILRFLDAYPGSSFHTCSGGSSYSHTFDIQRYANTNYFADGGRGPLTNYFFSYIEPPDKWVDIIEPFSKGGAYDRATARQSLTMVPFWGLKASPKDRELIREDLDTYKYLLKEGVAGRWSYMFHPEIKGDDVFHYAQRISYDRLKSCIIIKHQAPENVLVFPNGLVAGHKYEIAFDQVQEKTERTGADLMKNGILLKKALPGELIYLGLPKRPRSNSDKVPPTAPGSAFKKQEVNIGYSGMGVYWSAGTDNNWVSYYEVRRNNIILDKVSTGTYYFDRSEGWGLQNSYEIRTIDGDGNTSGWIAAVPIPGLAVSVSALGGLFDQQGRDGWLAEQTKDGLTFQPMKWIPPLKTSSADEGGTPNQPGGIEGWWEGDQGTRLGRAWMRSSRTIASVRTWVAPKAGNVRIVSRVMREWYRQAAGTPMRARILKGVQPVWPVDSWAIIKLNDITGLTHDLILDVQKGDSIRFVLDRSDHPEIDIVAWMPRIEYQESLAPTQQKGREVRMICGSNQSYTDQSGNLWAKDAYFSGGRARSTASVIEGGDDTNLYRWGRTGKKFAYSIPVPQGLYTVRLLFAEPEFERIYARPLNVSINGREVLKNHDIRQDARAFRQAKDQVFRNIASNSEGKIMLAFSGGFDPYQLSRDAIIQGIEILPEAENVHRINCGSETDFVDWNSFIWSKDSLFSSGEVLRSVSEVKQATPTLYDQHLYQTASAGKELLYTVSVSPGLYNVQLKFAELWLKKAGLRQMDIFINNRKIWKAWDPATAAGETGMAIDLRAVHISPDNKGKITIRVKAVGENDAILQGIQIF